MVQWSLCLLVLFLCNLQLFIHCQRKELYHNFRHQADTVNDKVIALTFDDGPHEILTPRLLNVLKKYNVTCTFYVMGIKVNMHPEIIKRAIDEGHEIGNHGWDHPVMSKISREVLHNQINSTNVVINNAINMNPATMRPPYGKTNGGMNKFLAINENLPVILWSLDIIDWKFPSTDEIVNRITQHIQPGDIILAHDIFKNTIESMPNLLEAVLKLGFKFSTVSKLIQKDVK